MAKTTQAGAQVQVVRIGGNESMDLVDRASGKRFIESWPLKLLIDRATQGSTQRSRELVWADVARVAEELAGPNPTPAESLLARAAAADWLALQHYRAQYQCLCMPGEGMSVPLSEHHQRRLTRTHRRMLASIRMIAVVRKLARPQATIRVKAAVANVAQVSGVPAAGALPGRASAAPEASRP